MRVEMGRATTSLHREPIQFTIPSAIQPKLRSMEAPRTDRDIALGAVVTHLLMVFWGQAPSARRAPRVILEPLPAQTSTHAESSDWFKAGARGA
jgi:hypothetical protein